MNRLSTGSVMTIRMLSYWHIGSGMGRGADADAVVLKDQTGLPFIPGKTLKGLLRDSSLCLEDARLCSDGVTKLLFGAEGEKGNATQGSLAIDSAFLPDDERAWFSSAEGREHLKFLYDCFSTTALDDNGVALEHSLHTIEAAVPLELQARIDYISVPDGIDVTEHLSKCCALLRALGSHRNRGFGRCLCSIVERGA